MMGVGLTFPFPDQLRSAAKRQGSDSCQVNIYPDATDVESGDRIYISADFSA
jgi:hypothetical protein